MRKRILPAEEKPRFRRLLRSLAVRGDRVVAGGWECLVRGRPDRDRVAR
jgi:hypothetical protein